MIIDSRTNKVYLAQGLLHYMPAYMTLLKALTMENINNAFLPQTESVKHICNQMRKQGHNDRQDLPREFS